MIKGIERLIQSIAEALDISSRMKDFPRFNAVNPLTGFQHQQNSIQSVYYLRPSMAENPDIVGLEFVLRIDIVEFVRINLHALSIHPNH